MPRKFYTLLNAIVNPNYGGCIHALELQHELGRSDTHRLYCNVDTSYSNINLIYMPTFAAEYCSIFS